MTRSSMPSAGWVGKTRSCDRSANAGGGLTWDGASGTTSPGTCVPRALPTGESSSPSFNTSAAVAVSAHKPAVTAATTTATHLRIGRADARCGSLRFWGRWGRLHGSIPWLRYRRGCRLNRFVELRTRHCAHIHEGLDHPTPGGHLAQCVNDRHANRTRSRPVDFNDRVRFHTPHHMPAEIASIAYHGPRQCINPWSQGLILLTDIHFDLGISGMHHHEHVTGLHRHGRCKHGNDAENALDHQDLEKQVSNYRTTRYGFSHHVLRWVPGSTGPDVFILRTQSVRAYPSNGWPPWNYRPNNTSPGSLPPKINLLGSSIISFTLYRKLTLSLPSMMRWS